MRLYISYEYKGTKHAPHLTMHQRAAQFSPFAALKGYDEAVAGTQRIAEDAPLLDEYQKDEIDHRFGILRNFLENGKHPHATFRCFIPDETKDGGKTVEIKGTLRKIREFERELILEGGTVVKMDTVIGISEIS